MMWTLGFNSSTSRVELGNLIYMEEELSMVDQD